MKQLEGLLWIPAVSIEIEKARRLRSNQTSAESLLWRVLRYQKLGVKFRRQEPIEHYIVDFCCFSKRLIIELDGSIHDEPYQKSYDQERDRHLREQGFQIIRFRNEEVEQNLETVLRKIKMAISSPLPSAGEGSGRKENHGG